MNLGINNLHRLHNIVLYLCTCFLAHSILHLHSQPQCVPVTTSTCAAIFPQSYYIPVDDREENETFAIVAEISDQLDLFCSNALNFYTCYFIHPPCDPDRGISDFRIYTF